MEFLIIKWIHIISSTLLFGTGLGSAFYKLLADRSNNTQVIYQTNKNVVFADWIFTTPTIIIQPLTGFILVTQAGYKLTESWLLLSFVFFIIAGLCWLPVVLLQIRMRELSFIAVKTNSELSDQYWRYSRMWILLGIPAFFSTLAIFYLMTNKPIIFNILETSTL